MLHERTLRGRPALDIAGNGRYARQLVEAAEQYRDMRLAQGIDIESLDVDRLQEINGADMAEAIASVHAHLNMRE
ncbi:ESX-1 secretion system EccA1 domain protein [Mycobacterium kansasii]|nr:ESX-1 secretion system EccA1 domain protein [Mycobacterium kansasii]